MKEPILSADELTHAARALLMAVIGAPHDIECNSVTVHFDSKKPGHNALNQMSSRIEAELGALLEKLCGEPVAWEYRHFNSHESEWESWEKLEPRNPHVDTIQDRVNEIRDYIAFGYKYELRALYALNRSQS